MGIFKTKSNMKLVFVTSNKNKVFEINSLLPTGFELMMPSEIGFNEEIEETADTIAGNALLKAQAIGENMGIACFAEDTGLEIEALGGEPGVLTARYAFSKGCNQDNLSLVLDKMKPHENRVARFVTVLIFFDGRAYFQFEGICEGKIALASRGERGFGYDPIFIPDGSELTFAEMTLDQKNIFSHRKKAFQKFIVHLIN
jgi:XTP/dITP diphosphohydrolase